MPVTAADPLKIILAILLPPVGVFTEVGRPTSRTGGDPRHRGCCTQQTRTGGGSHQQAPV